jgi:hypothetical protein
MTGLGNYGFGQRPLRPTPAKARVFVSYHHQRDQPYYDRFAEIFADGYEIITDTSIDRKIGGDNVDYQQQVIREQHITGSSVTIVLCGAETWKRRWADWEICKRRPQPGTARTFTRCSPHRCPKSTDRRYST